MRVERDILVTEAQYKMNGDIIGGILGIIIVLVYANMSDCSNQMVLWFMLFTLYCVTHICFLAIFIYTDKVSSLIYQISTYPLDVVIVGLFVYGFIIFSNLTEEGSESHPFPYYMMLLILIVQLATCLKYVSGGILVGVGIPVVAYLIIREIRNRREIQRQQMPWETFENDIFNNLDIKSFDTEIEQIYDSGSICLVDFTRGEKIIFLPCSRNHNFHKGGIRQWFLRKRTGPLGQHQMER